MVEHAAMPMTIVLHLFRVVDAAPRMLCGAEPTEGRPTMGLAVSVWEALGEGAMPADNDVAKCEECFAGAGR